jgi:hypothetical protein
MVTGKREGKSGGWAFQQETVNRLTSRLPLRQLFEIELADSMARTRQQTAEDH